MRPSEHDQTADRAATSPRLGFVVAIDCRHPGFATRGVGWTPQTLAQLAAVLRRLADRLEDDDVSEDVRAGEVGLAGTDRVATARFTYPDRRS